MGMAERVISKVRLSVVSSHCIGVAMMTVVNSRASKYSDRCLRQLGMWSSEWEAMVSAGVDGTGELLHNYNALLLHLPMSFTVES